MSKYTSNQFEINENGYYGKDEFGGRYVLEILLASLEELEMAFEKYRNDPDFLADLSDLRENFAGRPSPVIFARNLTEQIGGAKIYFKNEGNNHTGSHKINHCIYQALIAKRMGKTRIVCETGAGQHGVACATVCAKFGLECVVYMGQKDIQKQYPNVFFMKQLGAKVVSVLKGNQSLVDAVDEALGDYLQNPESYYMLGSAVGPHPYPEIIREAQKIISVESKQQILKMTGKLPDMVVACIGGGSNAIGAFNEYLYDENVLLVGVEAAGLGLDKLGNHSSRLHSKIGSVGVMQGFKSYFLLDKNGQNITTNSIASGLNYAGIGPIHAYLYEQKRLEISSATDFEIQETFKLVARNEGILPALESTHAIVETLKRAKNMPKDSVILANISGRADNYLFNLAKAFEDKDFETFCQNFEL